MPMYKDENFQDSDDYYLYPDKSLQSALVIEKRVELVDTYDTGVPPSVQEETLESEWQNTFHIAPFVLRLKEKALSGKLRNSSFRSVAWQIFLGNLPVSISDWSVAVKTSRDKYDWLKMQYVVDPHGSTDMSLSVNNPLSQEEHSPWAQFFQDNELRKEIMQDITRTYPGELMFEQEEVRQMMLNILFIYAREEPEISYKQGMHELLAPLVYTLYTEYMLVRDVALPSSQLMKKVLNLEYLEHDLYWCYVKLMRYMVSYYKTDSIKVEKEEDTMEEAKLFQTLSTQPSTYIVHKLSELQNTTLRRFDAELHQHLDKLNIQPQLYGLRWVRLLFGREFSLKDTLVIWDALLASPDFGGMVEYLCVAMLLYIRDELLCSDFTGCLTLLMRYPEAPTVQFFIQRALYLRNPSRYECPPNWQYRPHGKNILMSNGSMSHGSRLNYKPERADSFSKNPVSALSDTLKRKIHRPVTKPTTPITYSAPQLSQHPPQSQRHLQSTEEKAVMSYCSSKLDVLINNLQETFTEIEEEGTKYEDKLMVSLAGLKQIRDVLKGNVSLGSVVAGSDMLSGSETTSVQSFEQQVPESSSAGTTNMALSEDQDRGQTESTKHDSHPLPTNLETHTSTPIPPVSTLPPGDMETLNLFADLSLSSKTIKKKKEMPEKDSEQLQSKKSQDFSDPLSCALAEDSSDEFPDFMKSR